MTFESADSYTLTSDDGQSSHWTKDKLAIFIHKYNLAYRYVAKSERKGTLELFNDEIDLVFKVNLHTY